MRSPHLITAACLLVALACGSIAVAQGEAPDPAVTPAPLSIEQDEGDTGTVERPCVRFDLATDAVKDLCKTGGQPAVQRFMTQFVREVNRELGERIMCKDCHTRLAPEFPPTEDALERFVDLQRRLADKRGDTTPETPEAPVDPDGHAALMDYLRR
jgi:hypothetical protein